MTAIFDLTGQFALVTGASGGIGAAIARSLHAQGAHVVLGGRRRDALQSLAAELGGGCSIVEGDVVGAGAADALIGAAAAAGGLDILVNNAGITRDTLALRMKDEDWDAVLDTNLRACFQLSRAALKLMVKRRQGRIINIGSIVGTTGNPGQANYAAAKAGLIGMSKALAAEVAGRGVTVNVVAPGFIATPMTDALSDQQKAAILARVPAGRLGTGGDVAAAVCYLAGPGGAYVTGQTIHVNGGMAMV
ncbi:3-oxoacyl-[acyl-carrier-protein] reductase [Arboricoccus pini]|uniref:3-oxoacyl-[acyl-carrier-protein] reductase n=1 Tax=Arboricoccus pini TaxID=1963835 RepID=A0A212QS95_9PROT|nr:3-oxoacyl-[acyl-carrier-protein] reductase [Arboricoccus pini]